MATIRFRSSPEYADLDRRFQVLETYGIYSSLSKLKSAVEGVDKPYTLVTPAGLVNYSYVEGNFTGKADDVNIIKLGNVSLSTGALVCQNGNTINFDNRSINTKLLERISVKDTRFGGGAKGDGVAVDALAIQALVDSVGNDCIVEFPKGTYVFDRQITIQGKRNIIFTGAGKIKGTSNRLASYFKLDNCSRISFSDLSFDQMQNVLPIYTHVDYPNGIYNCAIEIQTSDRVVVKNCTFENLYTRAVFARNSSDIDVSNNLFTSPVQNQTLNGSPGAQELQHVHLQTCSGILVYNNRFMNSAITSPANGVCSVFASGIRRYAVIERNYSEYAGRDNSGTHRLGVIDFYGDAQTVRIVNNVSINGMAQFARVSSTRGAVVAHNRIQASVNAELDYSMVTLEGVVAFAPGETGILDNIVRDNLFQDPAHRHAFAIGIISYDYGTPSLRTIVDANSFDGCRRSVLVRGPFYDTVIINNGMRGAAGSIMVDQNTLITSTFGTEANSVYRNLRIEGNSFLDESNGNSSAISINLSKTPAYTGTADHFLIFRNIIRSTKTGVNEGQAIAVSLLAQTLTGHVRIEQNEITNYRTGIYQRKALIATIDGNRLLSCPTPILVDSDVGTVYRQNNRYSSGPMRGVATLNAGGVSVPTAEIRVNDVIRLTRQRGDGTVGHIYVGTISDGTSFTIVSSSSTDTSTVLWEIIH